jgi:hypothetical protein
LAKTLQPNNNINRPTIPFFNLLTLFCAMLLINFLFYLSLHLDVDE